LSNFYPHKIVYGGELYSTSEHAYQAAKFLDPDIKQMMRESSTQGQVKRLSRKYPNDIREDWNIVRIGVMYDILKIKFSDEKLRQKLLGVDEPIVEHNDWGDTFWGVCDGKGENKLGKILERIKMEEQVF